MKLFQEWAINTDKELAEIETLLNEELSDDTNSLIEQLKKLESHGYRILKLMAESEVYLRLALATGLREIKDLDLDYTVDETEICLNETTATEKRYFTILRSLIGDRHNSGLISRRISLGQSFLANAREMARGGV
jgi:hypothetical protein